MTISGHVLAVKKRSTALSPEEVAISLVALASLSPPVGDRSLLLAEGDNSNELISQPRT